MFDKDASLRHMPRFVIAFALMRARKLVRGLRQGLRRLASSATANKRKRRGRNVCYWR